LKWFINCIKNYAVFKGRASRPEFWYFVLVSAIIQISLFIIDTIIGWDVGIIDGMKTFPLFEISRLLLLIPTISVTVRRLHDINKNGWWSLLWGLPVIGWAILILWLSKKEGEGKNQYGLAE
jgi:uncharacterized membrane protein YhaH (DUF805 family)|tara:strand:- start:2830 stop:3195 length:366 start_codon:yes stop_codon:yes gene_type:complete